jgi:hypothetical protein
MNYIPLSSQQRDYAHQKAKERILALIGPKPTRDQFLKEYGRLWGILDVLVLLIFLAALAISSAHIVKHMGSLSSAVDLTRFNGGLQINESTWIAVHQFGFIVLAESAMLLFMILFSMERKWWRRILSLLLAITAMSFVISANIQSGIGTLESIMPPLFTIGIGLHIERLIVQAIKRRNSVQVAYETALIEWERSTASTEAHPNWKRVYRETLFDTLVDAQVGRGKSERQAYLRELSPGQKLRLVNQEINASSWAEGKSEDTPSTTTPAKPNSGAAVDPDASGSFYVNGAGIQ